MKKILFLATLALLICACNSNSKKVDEAYTLENLMMNASELVEDTITVVGKVGHTCRNSGKRCFLANEDKSLTFRIEAGEEIGVFDKSLVGSTIEARGVLKEFKLPQEKINEQEERLNEAKKQEGANHEGCESGLQNINKMREWMKSHNKDYYSIYYMDGLSYEVKEEKKEEK